MRALISVSDKRGIVAFAQGLVDLGYDIISTGGTLSLLQKNNVPVTPVDAVTGFPEMLDGRVKTLHPKIHGGLLALRNNPEHVATCKAHDITFIDLVVVNLYPFEKTISNPNVHLEDAIENIDIGGPSMLRSGAKNYQSVGIIVDPDQYEALLAEMKQNAGTLSLKTKEKLAAKVFAHTSHYDGMIAQFLAKQFEESEATSSFPQTVQPRLTKNAELRYGENPHQKAAFYILEGVNGFGELKQLHGKELSYNNIVDLEAAVLLVKETEKPAAVIIKHTNPCGAAIGDSLLAAYKKAYDADPVSAFGSIIGLNKTVDKATATEIAKTFVEAVIAPGFDADALTLLQEKAAIRLMVLDPFNFVEDRPVFKYVHGGFLLQSPDTVSVQKEQLQTVTKTAPTPKQIEELLFAFSIVKYVKSNAIVVVKDGQVVGVGAGQMSRVEAVEIALKKAGEKAKGAVLASDAFFPFKDSVELAAAAGISAIIQPGGSKRDQESIETSDANGISMVMTGIRHFRH